MNLELKKAIDQISKDKGLDRDMLVDTLEDAVRTSVIRKYGENIDVEVSYNDDTGEIQVHQFKIVVDDVADPDTEIDIEKARELDPSVQLRRRADLDRFQIDVPGRDTLEHGHPDRGGRTGRLNPRGRIQTRLRRQADQRDAHAAHADDDQRITSGR